MIEELKTIHRLIKNDIEKQLASFRQIGSTADDRCLFIELAFCLLTPQSRARQCWKTVEGLVSSGALFHGTIDDLRRGIHPVRFKNNKAAYIAAARNAFLKESGLRTMIKQGGDIRLTRRRLVAGIKGMGFKEASHFLRNIGQGDEVAILDRHVLRCLTELEAIPSVPTSLSPVRYEAIEEQMKRLAADCGIPLAHLDFVFFYKGARDVFK